MKVTIIAGARPNFMKIAPIIQAIESDPCKKITYRLVHTGQHFDQKMSGDFFVELGIPEPDINLGAGGGTQAEQTAAIMVSFERELVENPADLVMVVGDVTSTMACSIVAKKLCVKVAHVEAGIRSFDLTMPEEINRMVTDCLADVFFTTSRTANQNLKKAGIDEERIVFVGNVMIDTLLKNLPRLKKPDFFDQLRLVPDQYLVLTLHRPANVDQEEGLRRMVDEIVRTSQGLPIIFPMHPRTAKVFKKLNISAPNLHIVNPLGYLGFNFLVKNCKAVLTDSGGITEETTVLGIPCLTLRDSTERPETVSEGTNELVGTNPDKLEPYMTKLFQGNWKQGECPELWDGKAAVRIVAHLKTKE